MRAWIDVDNPPQARYLLPLSRHFESAGCDVLLTARAYGDTFSILESEGARFEAIGATFGKGMSHRLYGLRQRTRLLISFLRAQEQPVGLVVTGSRAATLAARALGIPSFVIIDYEYVNLLLYALSGAHVLHPDVIEPTVFRRRGVPLKRLIPFAGLKEDITFDGLDLLSISPYPLEVHGATRPLVLFRPPAEESHYYRAASGELAGAVLRHLSTQPVRVVFSPRYPWQVSQVDEISDWAEPPLILEEPIPAVALLKAVDAVISAGGTMLREAAYLGIPAFSIFRGSMGAVDRYLASIGRLQMLRSRADLVRLEVPTRPPVSPLRAGSTAARDVVTTVLDRAGALQARQRTFA